MSIKQEPGRVAPARALKHDSRKGSRASKDSRAAGQVQAPFAFELVEAPPTAPEQGTWSDVAAGPMPYGRWVCHSGREILFDRNYKPKWQRKGPGQPVEPADPDEWV